jgi:uncharacterized coiled-coil DUF342 family protein
MIIDKPYYMNRRDNPNSSVRSKEKVYCINVEYDHIREILQRDQEIWDRFKGMYWFKKYHNYIGTIKRIADEYKKEYVVRFSAEFKRSLELDEIEEALFTKNEWAAIKFLVTDPDGYYVSKVLTTANERKLEKQINTLNARIKKLNKYKKEAAALQTEVDKLKTQNNKQKKEIAALRNSVSFRIGKIFTFIPGKIKRLIKKK